MSLGGTMFLIALLIAGVGGTISRTVLLLGAGGFIVFLVGAVLHDHTIDRGSTARDSPHMGDADPG